MKTEDLAKIADVCPELAEIIEGLEKFRIEWEHNPSNMSFRTTPEKIDAIAAAFLKLMEYYRAIINYIESKPHEELMDYETTLDLVLKMCKEALEKETPDGRTA